MPKVQVFRSAKPLFSQKAPLLLRVSVFLEARAMLRLRVLLRPKVLAALRGQPRPQLRGLPSPRVLEAQEELRKLRALARLLLRGPAAHPGREVLLPRARRLPWVSELRVARGRLQASRQGAVRLQGMEARRALRRLVLRVRLSTRRRVRLPVRALRGRRHSRRRPAQVLAPAREALRPEDLPRPLLPERLLA